MALAVLKSIHYISLYVFLGAPIFWHLLWRPAADKASASEESAGEGLVASAVYKNVETGLLLGVAAFAVSGLAGALVAGSFGWPVLGKVGLAAAAAAAWHLAGPAAGVGWISGAAALSTGFVVVMGLLSRAADNPGIFPVASHVVHLIASNAWIGGLLYLAVLPWKSIGADGVAGSGRRGPLGESTGPTTAGLLAAFMERFSLVGFVAVALIAGTGAFASYVHVYTPLAFQQTAYGRTLAVKIALFLVLLLVAAVNFLFIVPALRRDHPSDGRTAAGAPLRRLGTVFRVEAAVVAALLIVTGMLSSLSPADAVDDLARGVWQLDLNRGVLTAEMSAGDVPGELQLDLHIKDATGRPLSEDAQVVVDLHMPAHDMGLRPLDAEPVGPGHFRTKPLLSMEGEWEALVTVTPIGGAEDSASFAFEAFQAARSAGMTRRLEPRAIFFEFLAERAERAADEDYAFSLREFIQDLVFSLDPRPLQFVSGSFWFIAAVFVVVAALRGGFPRWVAPLGMIALGVGAYFLLSSMLVNAYPTSYAANPVPFTSESVDAGYELYVSHCSVCHGPEGHGDGPMAPFIDPPPEDLRVRHIDAHPDGELFWWFTYGIPGSDMPGNEATMTEEERWHVVNFVRSLHRPAPDVGQP